MSEYDKISKQPCKICGAKTVNRVFNIPDIHVPKTLGSLMDKNTNRLSEDEKRYLKNKTRKRRRGA
jgi:hypothetical protein